MSTQAVPEMADLKNRLKITWMTGDYDTFARPMEAGAAEFVRRLAIPAGAKFLDVGCGAGQIGLIAARNGAKVTGCDIATNWLEKARARAKAEGLAAKFEEGDAEALPYPDASFDVVASMWGAMFAPRPELVASEFTRVCRPGGFIAMANWTPGGFVGQMFKIIARHIAPSGMPSPVLWGDQATVRQRFSKGIAELRMTPRMFPFDYKMTPAEVTEFFRMYYGPITRAFAALNESEQQVLRRELTDLWSSHNKGLTGETRVDGEYLEIVAIRD